MNDGTPTAPTRFVPNPGGMLGLGIVMLVIAIGLTLMESTRTVGFSFLAIGTSFIAIGAALRARHGTARDDDGAEGPAPDQ